MASDVVSVEIGPGQVVYVEVDRDVRLSAQFGAGQPGFAAAGAPKPEEIIQRFEELAQYLVGRSEQFIRKYRELAADARPSKVSVEFAIGVEGSAGVPFLANGKGTANIKIAAEWSDASEADATTE